LPFQCPIMAYILKIYAHGTWFEVPGRFNRRSHARLMLRDLKRLVGGWRITAYQIVWVRYWWEGLVYSIGQKCVCVCVGASKHSQEAPRCSQEAPRGPQEALRDSQEAPWGPKSTPRGPKRLPRDPQEDPKGPQEPKGDPRRPQGTQKGHSSFWQFYRGTKLGGGGGLP
jgi:hypothetical protein